MFENVCQKADIIVAHNIKFDKIVMETAFHRRDDNDNDNGITTSTKIGSSSYSSFMDLLSSKRLICTMIKSTNLCKIPSKFNKSSKVSSYKWPSLLEAYNFASNETKKELDGGGHDAMVDAEACLKVFKYLVDNGHVTTSTTTELQPTTSTTQQFITTETQSSNLNSTATTKKTRIKESHHHPSMTTLTTAESTNILGGSVGDDDNVVEGGGKVLSSSIIPNTMGTSSSSSNSNSNKNNGFKVRGNTYRHKETIKQLGGKWDGQSKEWTFYDLDNDNSMKALSRLESYQDLELHKFDINSNSSNNNNNNSHNNDNSTNSSNRA